MIQITSHQFLQNREAIYNSQESKQKSSNLTVMRFYFKKSDAVIFQ